MSLFQCDVCGCCENTALSEGSRAYMNNHFWSKHPEVAESYRNILGINSNQPFGKYCCVCTPAWIDSDGFYGIGPNPNKTIGKGIWHNKFPREFYPLNTMETDRFGNLRSK